MPTTSNRSSGKNVSTADATRIMKKIRHGGQNKTGMSDKQAYKRILDGAHRGGVNSHKSDK